MTEREPTLTANCWGENAMNWWRDKDWRCETCGDDGYALEWLLVHGCCWCSRCGTHYTMLLNGEHITRPISLLKPEYKAAAKAGWVVWGTPLPSLQWQVGQSWPLPEPCVLARRTLHQTSASTWRRR